MEILIISRAPIWVIFQTSVTFVVILGSVSIPMLFTPFLILGRFLVGSQVYIEFTEYVMIPNTGFIRKFFQPLVYGLYFKQVREQMMRCLKRWNKVNSIAIQS